MSARVGEAVDPGPEREGYGYGPSSLLLASSSSSSTSSSFSTLSTGKFTSSSSSSSSVLSVGSVSSTTSNDPDRNSKGLQSRSVLGTDADANTNTNDETSSRRRKGYSYSSLDDNTDTDTYTNTDTNTDPTSSQAPQPNMKMNFFRSSSSSGSYIPLNKHDDDPHRRSASSSNSGGGGGGRSRGLGGFQFLGLNWKKFVVLVCIVLGLLYLFGGRGGVREGAVGGSGTGSGDAWYDPDVDLDPLPAKPEAPATTRPAVGGGDDEVPPKDSSDSEAETETSHDSLKVPRPYSPETDPDPSKTVYCTKPHDASSPLVQYALMIDAGSTGSRIHIYKFHNCFSAPTYEYEVFKQTQPGLSYYKGAPEEAAKSLDELFEEAVRVVPRELAGCSVVAVKATAGLRLLGQEESEAILESVRKRIEERYPFVLAEKDAVVIMDGRDEGVYAWITANYLLDTIRADSPKDEGHRPYAVLDLGGGSTQIVFEPEFVEDEEMEEGDHKYELVFGGKRHVLYQHSFLGYGLMSARLSVHRLVEFMATVVHSQAAETTSGDEDEEREVPNPCLAKGTRRRVTLKPAREGEVERNVTMVGEDVGSFEACNRIVELVMAKDALCHVKPCSFNGVYQPSVLSTFTHGKILLLSYFYDRLSPFFSAPTSPDSASALAFPLRVSSFASLAPDVCGGMTVWKKRWGDNEAFLRELEDRPEWCLDLTFMNGLLRLGYEFGEDREVRTEKKVEGTELGWCLGATIALIGGELSCKV